MAEREPNRRLADAIAQANWTYDGVARAVRAVAAENGELLQTNKSAVAHWVRGTRPYERTAQYLAEAISRRTNRPTTPWDLGLTDEAPRAGNADPVTEAITLGRTALDLGNPLAVAAFTASDVGLPLHYDHEAVRRMLRARQHGAAVGTEEITVIRGITDAFFAADERLGGGHGLSTVTAYLTDTAAPVLTGRYADAAARSEAFGAVAELAYLAGWKHHDLGQEGAAQRYYLVAYRLACEADPRGHAAWMIRALAHQALSLNRPQQCVALTENALRRATGYVDGATEAMLHIIHARACAAVGSRPEAAKALVAAEDALHRGDAHRPRFSSSAGSIDGAVASHTAKALTVLGDHVGTERQHRAALISWDPEAYKRVQMLTLADLGDSLAAQTRADEAVATWSQALDKMESMASKRTRAAIGSIRPTLQTYKRRGVPGAAELDLRAAEVLR